MPQRSRGKKRRLNGSTAIVRLSKTGRVKTLRIKRKGGSRGKRKYNGKYGYSNKRLSFSELKRIVSKPIIPTIATPTGNGSGLSPIHRCKQRMHFRYQRTFDGVGGTPIACLKMNSAEDPTGDIGTQQADGKDQLEGLYKNYLVTKCSVWFRPVYDPEDTNTLRLSYWAHPRSASTNEFDSFQEALKRGMRIKYTNCAVGNETDNDFKRAGPIWKSGNLTCSNYMDDSGAGKYLATAGVASITGDPSSLAELELYCAEGDGTALANTITQTFEVWITQEVIYFGLKSTADV